MFLKVLSRILPSTLRKPLFLLLNSSRVLFYQSDCNCRNFRSLFCKFFVPFLLTDGRRMPKGKKTSKANEKADSSTSTANSAQSAVTMSKDGSIIINVQAKPGAKQNNITEVSEQCVGIQISAPPKEGEANEELVSYLAALLGVKKSAVTLERGSKSRQKTVSIEGRNLTVENVMASLLKEVAGS
ncbi:UPF0235 protein C15orf40 homolog [Actinia tenebrosa]|uniref:UPF0235 protein C15orf40 homolog n=1 Tax=Actinia tenebrosa TaxID=6105 RepID=A0A6P8HH90_ACTTE|nr:UPF0235 protein C15orf40 homolog [Actinia tenebrosa]